MTSISQLNKICKLYGGMNTMNASSSTTSQISLPSETQSRNELSKYLSIIKNQVSTQSSDSQANNNDAAQSSPNAQVENYQNKLSKVSRITQEYANKVVSGVKYVASPLRLYIKANTAFMNPTERINFVSNINASDIVKNDFVSNWTVDDHYGLMVFIKMIRFKQQIFPNITNHEEYMACFRPNDPSARNCPNFEQLFAISQYLFNIALNTSYPTKVKQLYETCRTELLNYANENEMEDMYDYLLSDFNAKISFEINLAVNMIDIPVKIKLLDGTEVRRNRQELLQEIFNIFESKKTIPDAQMLVHNMQEWLQSDPPTQQAGKKRKPQKKSQRKKK
jgi:hypothetical protein